MLKGKKAEWRGANGAFGYAEGVDQNIYLKSTVDFLYFIFYNIFKFSLKGPHRLEA
jgi:hypothetical protein